MKANATTNIPVFDAGPEAAPLFKERVLWVLLMGGLFFLFYGSANEFSSLTAPHPSFYWEWEKSIPFIPELILPYMSSDVIFIVAFLISPTRRSIQKLGLRCALAILFSVAVFLLFPLQFDFVRPEVTGWTKPFFDALSLDKPYNQLPSLHISLGYICWRAIHERAGPVLRVLAVIWFLLIGLSTVMVFQHHSIDILGGIVVIYLVHLCVPFQGNGWVSLRFITPRHLHMALRYFIPAAALIISCFLLPAFWPVLMWIGLSLLLVSASYVLGWNNFLRKKNGRYDVVTWLLFWPYLIGSWLNWRFWRRRIDLGAEIVPGVWIGARPAKTDWRWLEENQIKSVIDLVPELSSVVPEGVHYTDFPLLDIAIPAPETLESIAHEIEARRQAGGVYIHCALGMSRSVLAVSAWLMQQGYTATEAFALIDQLRSHRVTRPYMAISLDLLDRHRRELAMGEVS